MDINEENIFSIINNLRGNNPKEIEYASNMITSIKNENPVQLINVLNNILNTLIKDTDNYSFHILHTLFILKGIIHDFYKVEYLIISNLEERIFYLINETNAHISEVCIMLCSLIYNIDSNFISYLFRAFNILQQTQDEKLKISMLKLFREVLRVGKSFNTMMLVDIENAVRQIIDTSYFVENVKTDESHVMLCFEIMRYLFKIDTEMYNTIDFLNRILNYFSFYVNKITKPSFFKLFFGIIGDLFIKFYDHKDFEPGIFYSISIHDFKFSMDKLYSQIKYIKRIVFFEHKRYKNYLLYKKLIYNFKIWFEREVDTTQYPSLYIKYSTFLNTAVCEQCSMVFNVLVNLLITPEERHSEEINEEYQNTYLFNILYYLFQMNEEKYGPLLINIFDKYSNSHDWISRNGCCLILAILANKNKSENARQYISLNLHYIFRCMESHIDFLCDTALFSLYHISKYYNIRTITSVDYIQVLCLNVIPGYIKRHPVLLNRSFQVIIRYIDTYWRVNTDIINIYIKLIEYRTQLLEMMYFDDICENYYRSISKILEKLDVQNFFQNEYIVQDNINFLLYLFSNSHHDIKLVKQDSILDFLYFIVIKCKKIINNSVKNMNEDEKIATITRSNKLCKFIAVQLSTIFLKNYNEFISSRLLFVLAESFTSLDKDSDSDLINNIYNKLVPIMQLWIQSGSTYYLGNGIILLSILFNCAPELLLNDFIPQMNFLIDIAISENYKSVLGSNIIKAFGKLLNIFTPETNITLDTEMLRILLNIAEMYMQEVSFSDKAVQIEESNELLQYLFEMYSGIIKASLKNLDFIKENRKRLFVDCTSFYQKFPNKNKNSTYSVLMYYKTLVSIPKIRGYNFNTSINTDLNRKNMIFIISYFDNKKLEYFKKEAQNTFICLKKY